MKDIMDSKKRDHTSMLSTILNNNSELSEFEMSAIKLIVSTEIPVVSSHINYLAIENRVYTGVGIIINFSYLEPIKSNETFRGMFGTSLYADINDLKYGAGFALCIESGKIDSLEMFTHGPEDWPQNIDNYNLKYLE